MKTATSSGTESGTGIRFVGQGEKLRKRAVAPEDSEHGAILAMTRETRGTTGASPASSVDLTDHTPSAKCRV